MGQRGLNRGWLQPVLAGETTTDDVTVQLPRPGLSLLLCDRAELAVQYSEEADLPHMALHCAGLEREDQAQLTREFEAIQERIESEGVQFLTLERSTVKSWATIAYLVAPQALLCLSLPLTPLYKSTLLPIRPPPPPLSQ